MDRHLSIFTPFSYSGRENNLTRALIILLQREPLFFSMFLERITEKGLDQQLLEEEIEFDTQRACKDFNNLEGIEKIYGVTLNTDKYETNIEESRETENPVTDISIQLGNILIIIEVKPHGEDPRKQLNNQIDKINLGNIEKEFKSLNWEELLNITISMEKFRKRIKYSNIFLTEFNRFIEDNYPELLPTAKITTHISFERAERRMRQIERELNIVIHGEKFEENPDFIKLKDCKIAERFKLYFQEDEKGSKKICLSLWPGDNNFQGNIFYKNSFNMREIEENLKNNLKIENLVFDKDYDILLYQYIKFAHIMGKGVYWENIGSGKNILSVYNQIKGITKKNDTERWENLKMEIGKYVDDKDKFLENFKKYFEDSNRNFVNINIGTHIKLAFDVDYIEKIERENKTVEFFKNVIDRVLEIIQK